MADLKYAVDVHSEWGADLSGMIARHNPDHVILHTYHGFESPRHAVTMRNQAASVQANGKSVGYYAWGFQAYSPTQTVNESVALFRDATGHDVPVGFIDCEPYNDDAFHDPGPDVDWLHEAGAALDALGVRKGLYTSPEYAIHRWGDRAHELSDWLLWLAHWDGAAQMTSDYMPLYGWHELAAKQWAVDIPGDESIDRDVIWEQYTVPMDAPQHEPSKDEIIEGLRIALDDVASARLGDDIRAAEEVVARLKATQAEARRIRVQFLGES